MKSRLRLKHNIKFNTKQRRIRCIRHIINLSLQAFLLASSREALLAALKSTAEVSGEELIVQFSEVLDSQRQRNRAEYMQWNEFGGSRLSQRSARRRDSQDSVRDEFLGIQDMPTLRKLHDLAV